jgi:predicted N-acetyltransferase YhbS
VKDVACATVRESDVDPNLRVRLVALFPRNWLSSPERAERAWTQQPPVVRIVASTAVEPVGQASVCALREEPPLVFGVGDVVVAEDWRRKGIGRRILELAVATADEVKADVIVVASRDSGVRRILSDLGFRNARPHELVFRRGDLVCWNETWMVRSRVTHDLLEIQGDV